MDMIQEVPRLKIHLIEEDSPRPFCGRAAWRGGWQVVIDDMQGSVCKNCVKVWRTRKRKSELDDGHDHDEHQ